MPVSKRPFAIAISLIALMAPACAADLVIGSSTEPQSIDPHFSRTGNNQNIAENIFERLVTPDATLGIHPGLADSWTAVDPNTWRIKLHPGITFQDGKPFTADDVIFSLERVKTIANSPAPFTGNVTNIASMKALDPMTVEFKTTTPSPDFMEQVGFVFIVEKAAAEGKSSDAFGKGGVAIGTGPYKFKEWVPGDHLALTRNETFWRGKVDFDNVTIKFISNNAARVAALRSGSVDLIDAVPPEDVPTLQKANGLKVFSTASARLIYLALDSSRDETPFVVDLDGKPLKSNPLKDKRVRQALQKMVDIPLIIDRILGGAGDPAGQLVPPGVAGNNPDLKPVAFDLPGAKQLLAQAGYEKGFGITIHSSNDRFPGDGGLAQALGQMFARGGLKVNGVVTQPYNVYAGNATKGSFSDFVFSLGNTTPTSAAGLRQLLMSVDTKTGAGVFNRTKYANPAFDAKMNEALAEFDDAKRLALLRDATKLVFDDVPLIPLYWQKVSWAGKSTLAYQANMSEDTNAGLASLAK